MLDLELREVTVSRDGLTLLDRVSAAFSRGTCTMVAGDDAATAALLAAVSGSSKVASGAVIIGTRDATRSSARVRPVLAAGTETEFPERWSVAHALIAAARTRSLDREDREVELREAIGRWQVDALADRRVRSLTPDELVRVRLARIELLRPAVLVAERLFAGASPSRSAVLAEEFHRLMRSCGATVISAPARREELAFAHRLLVLDAGRVVQDDAPAAIHARPRSETAARVTGEVNVIPLRIRGTEVESPIGSWSVDPPPFQGTGVALARPAAFSLCASGEDSDVIVAAEETGFAEHGWNVRARLSGGVPLVFEVPLEHVVRKGSLLALRYDPNRFTLIAKSLELPQLTVPTDVIPSRADSR